MSETINLLGGSQTFLGVIATLTILCILNNDGNFITKMLSLVFERIQKRIEILDKIKVTPSESTEMKLLVRFLSEENQDELHNEGAKVLRDINKNIDAKSIEYMGLESTNKPFLERVSTCSEHIMAPFYSFLYCLIVFMIIDTSNVRKDYVLFSKDAQDSLKGKDTL